VIQLTADCELLENPQLAVVLGPCIGLAAIGPIRSRGRVRDRVRTRRCRAGIFLPANSGALKVAP